jgi:hypothetical protein
VAVNSPWDRQPPGTVLVRFEDGSAIVKGDRSDADLEEMIRLFSDMKERTISQDALGVIYELRKHGLALKLFATPDERAFSREILEWIAETFRDINELDD